MLPSWNFALMDITPKLCDGQVASCWEGVKSMTKITELSLCRLIIIGKSWKFNRWKTTSLLGKYNNYDTFFCYVLQNKALEFLTCHVILNGYELYPAAWNVTVTVVPPLDVVPRFQTIFDLIRISWNFVFVLCVFLSIWIAMVLIGHEFNFSKMNLWMVLISQIQ